MKQTKIIIIVLYLISTSHVYSQIQSLSGEWDFRVDSVRELAKIKLPGSCEEQGFGTKSTVKDPHRLTREFRYVGKSWYQKTIEVPKEWQGKRLELFLERCLWETAVWLDGKPYGMENSLSAPHLYDFGYH